MKSTFRYVSPDKLGDVYIVTDTKRNGSALGATIALPNIECSVSQRLHAHVGHSKIMGVIINGRHRKSSREASASHVLNTLIIYVNAHLLVALYSVLVSNHMYLIRSPWTFRVWHFEAWFSWLVLGSGWHLSQLLSDRT
jgi:hypothetical protein